MNVATVPSRKPRKLPSGGMRRVGIRHIKLLCFLLVTVLVSACTGEDPTFYRWQHGEYVAKIYADMEEVGRLNDRYMRGEMGYLQYAEELARALSTMENHLLEFRQFLNDNRKKLIKAGINVTESEAWADTQLHLTGEIAQDVATKLEKKGYRGKILYELKRIGKYAEE